MSSATWGHQIDLLVRARTPLIWVRSNEEASSLLRTQIRGVRARTRRSI